MTDQLTYKTIRDRCESVAKEIVSEIADMDKAKEANTFDAWQEYLDTLESVEDEAHDHAHESVDSWDWTIYTHYGMQICDAVPYETLCDAESQYADIWGGEAPDGLYEYASRLAYLILVDMVSEHIREEVETSRELAEELQANCPPDTPDDGDYILSDFGTLGAGTLVTQYGKTLHIGDMESAKQFIREHMEQEKFWPSVYYVNDHGNTSQVFLSEEEES